ncbi:peptide deformylase [Candidatus Wolfebacteria bacterium]|nr:peptide deformylase [Candidatus Wolfebacteria bacterium]
MKILTINNKKEEKFLRTKTADFDFSKFSKKEINELLKQMKETMIKANGIGLSANQIGLNFKFFIAQIPKIEGDKIIGEKFYAIFNPEIIKSSEKTSFVEEGCLSVPEIYGEVERPEKITLIGRDKNNKKIRIKAEGIEARVFQHEIDHLNGILFIDKANGLHKIDNQNKQ